MQVVKANEYLLVNKGRRIRTSNRAIFEVSVHFKNSILYTYIKELNECKT